MWVSQFPVAVKAKLMLTAIHCLLYLPLCDATSIDCGDKSWICNAPKWSKNFHERPHHRRPRSDEWIRPTLTLYNTCFVGPTWVSPALKVVWRSWGLSLTSYPSPLSPPSVYNSTPPELGGWAKSWLGAKPSRAPLTLSRESAPKWRLDSFSHLCRAHRRDQQTDTQTDLPRYSVCSNGPLSLWCSLIMIITLTVGQRIWTRGHIAGYGRSFRVKVNVTLVSWEQCVGLYCAGFICYSGTI